jgi:phosphoribosyl-ATP pyrophosphohydrolase
MSSVTPSEPPLRDILAELTTVLEARKLGDPEQSYVARLFQKGQDAILKKVGEEATEVVMASKDQQADKIVSEMADLWFHGMVLLSYHGLTAAHVLDELQRRAGLSGLVEKANRSGGSISSVVKHSASSE